MKESMLLVLCGVLSVSSAESPYKLQKHLSESQYNAQNKTASSPDRLETQSGNSPYKSQNQASESPYRLVKQTVESPYRLEKHFSESPYKSEKHTVESPYTLQKELAESLYKSEKQTVESPYKPHKHLSEKRKTSFHNSGNQEKDLDSEDYPVLKGSTIVPVDVRQERRNDSLNTKQNTSSRLHSTLSDDTSDNSPSAVISIQNSRNDTSDVTETRAIYSPFIPKTRSEKVKYISSQGTTWVPKEALLDRQEELLDKREGDVAKKSWLYSYNIKIPRVFKSPFRRPYTSFQLQKSLFHKKNNPDIHIAGSQIKEGYKTENKMAERFEYQKNYKNKNKMVQSTEDDTAVTNMKNSNRKNNNLKSSHEITNSLVTITMSTNSKSPYHPSKPDWKHTTNSDGIQLQKAHNTNMNLTNENLKMHRLQFKRLDNKNPELLIANSEPVKDKKQTKSEWRHKGRIENYITHTTIRKPVNVVKEYDNDVKTGSSKSVSPFSSLRYSVIRHNQDVKSNTSSADVESVKRREEQKRLITNINIGNKEETHYLFNVDSSEKQTGLKEEENTRIPTEDKKKNRFKNIPYVEQSKIVKSPFSRRNENMNSFRYRETKKQKHTYTQSKAGYHGDRYRYTPLRQGNMMKYNKHVQTNKRKSISPHDGTIRSKPVKTSTPTTTRTTSSTTTKEHNSDDGFTNELSLEVETSTRKLIQKNEAVTPHSTLKKGGRIVWGRKSQRNWRNGRENENSRHGFIFSSRRRTTQHSVQIKSSTEKEREDTLEHDHVTVAISTQHSDSTETRSQKADDITNHSIRSETSTVESRSTQKNETVKPLLNLKQGHRIVWRRKTPRNWRDRTRNDISVRHRTTLPSGRRTSKRKDILVGPETTFPSGRQTTTRNDILVGPGTTFSSGRRTTTYPVPKESSTENRKHVTNSLSTNHGDSTQTHTHKADDSSPSRHDVETTTLLTRTTQENETVKPQYSLKQGQRIVWRKKTQQRVWNTRKQKDNSGGHGFIFSNVRRNKNPANSERSTENGSQGISKRKPVTISASAAAAGPLRDNLYSGLSHRSNVRHETSYKSPWSNQKQQRWLGYSSTNSQKGRVNRGYGSQRKDTPFSNTAINKKESKKASSERKGFMFSRFRQSSVSKITNETENRFNNVHRYDSRERDGRKAQEHERKLQNKITKYPVYKTDVSGFDELHNNSLAVNVDVKQHDLNSTDESNDNPDERKRWVKNTEVSNGGGLQKSIFSKTRSNVFNNNVLQTSSGRYYNDWVKPRNRQKNKRLNQTTKKPSWIQKTNTARITNNRTVLTQQDDPVRYLEQTSGDAPAIVINKNKDNDSTNNVYLEINKVKQQNITRKEFLKTHSRSPFFKRRPARVQVSEKQKPLPHFQERSRNIRDQYPRYKQIPIDVELPKGTPEGKPKDYDYGEVLYKSMLFYEAQRSGTLPRDSRVLWRGDSGIEDQGIYGEDLSGGWYDAGDYMKFGLPMAGSTTLLIWGLLEFHDAYEETGLLDNIYDTIKWPLDYFIKAHPTKFEFYAQVGDPYIDHSYWGRPEDMSMYRPSYRLTPERPGSDVIGETAAAMAAGYIAFKKRDPDYAYELLRHAEELYEFAERYQGRYSDSIPIVQEFYESSGYRDELSWAAAWLYKATNLRKYLVAADRNYDRGACWSQSWDEKRAGAMVLLYQLTKQDKYQEDIEETLKNWLPGGNIPYTPKGLAFGLQWGSLRYAANMAMVALVAANSGINTEEYRNWAKSQIHYMLGDSGRSYVVGFGEHAPSSPHHASSSCDPPPWSCTWADFSKAEANPHTLFGALVGGPDMFDNFVDDRADYIQNEVTCDYNAGFQSAVAGLMQVRLRKSNTVGDLRFKNAAAIDLKEIRHV